MNHHFLPVIALALGVSSTVISARRADAEEKRPEIRCEMRFSLKGWSVFYKTAKGDGVVTCSNGQSSPVKLRTKGGGLSFGASHIVEGKGTFSGVTDIRDVFGSYGAASAHAGAVKSAGAQALTKGAVSLGIAGTGSGVDIGFDFGKFVIEKAP